MADIIFLSAATALALVGIGFAFWMLVNSDKGGWPAKRNGP